jgi:hypothetical protein
MKRILLIILLSSIPAFGQPILRNYDTTNTTPVVLAKQTNSANGAIALDVTKQPASTTLSNLALGTYAALTNTQPASTNLSALSTNNAVNLTNLQSSGIAGPKFTGIITNGVGSGVVTNYEAITNGIVVTNKFSL